MTIENVTMRESFTAALQQAAAEAVLNRNQIITLLTAENGAEAQALYALADRFRQKYAGDAVHLRGIIEFSNYCANNCNYCGLRRENNDVVRFRMMRDEIIMQAEIVAELGIKTVVLQSGDDFWYTTEMICDIVREIKEKTGMAITLSIGERNKTEYAAFRAAGADRYLLKHETANPAIFRQCKPWEEPERRWAHLRLLKELGFEVGSGNMVGLPGQKLEDLADDLLFMRDYEIDMVGIGTFIPHEATPFANAATGDPVLTLKEVAVARILLKDINLPATTSLQTLLPDGLEKALRAGANVVMPNMTPPVYRKYYRIYPKKDATELNRIKAVIQSLGRTISDDYGWTPRRQRIK